MAEENANTMNLDLNLGPVDDSNDGGEAPYPNVAMNFEDWLHSPVHRVREVVRQRNHRWRSLWRQLPIPPETRNLALELIGGNAPQTGEASVVSDSEVAKICENVVEDEELGKRKDGGKGNGDEGSFFDCNICLDLAKDPVVTCCGHLFCWPCLYRWLHHHSEAKECPVCKGEVTTKHVTPIYGRGNGNVVREADVDSDSLKIPVRPHARRIESWRQTLERTATAFTIPMEEMIRRLGSAFDLNRELAQMQTRHESPERFLNRYRLLTSIAMRTPPPPPPPPTTLPTQTTDDVIDLTLTEMRERDSRRLLLRRSSSSHHRMNLVDAVESSYFPPPVDDRDSVSSIAAVIHSESQTVDNADSTVALSTSSSRRRNDASRISDVDTGDSRAPRRRRLN